MNMVISHDLLDGDFRLFCGLDNFISAIFLVLILLKVAFNDTVTKSAQLLHLRNKLTVLGILA